MVGRDSLTCISNNGPSLNWCWLVSPIKEGGKRGASHGHLHQTAGLSILLHKWQRERKEEEIVPVPLLKSSKSFLRSYGECRIL